MSAIMKWRLELKIVEKSVHYRYVFPLNPLIRSHKGQSKAEDEK